MCLPPSLFPSLPPSLPPSFPLSLPPSLPPSLLPSLANIPLSNTDICTHFERIDEGPTKFKLIGCSGRALGFDGNGALSLMIMVSHDKSLAYLHTAVAVATHTKLVYTIYANTLLYVYNVMYMYICANLKFGQTYDFLRKPRIRTLRTRHCHWSKPISGLSPGHVALSRACPLPISFALALTLGLSLALACVVSFHLGRYCVYVALTNDCSK